MTDIASLSVEINSDDAVDLKERQDAATESGARLEAQTERLTASSTRATIAAQNRGMADSTAAVAAQRTADAILLQDKAVQQILARYDPLGAKMRQLIADQEKLRQAMGDSVRPDVMKAFQGLEDEITQVGKLMDDAGASAEDLGKKGEAAGTHLGLGSAYARRELIILGREAMSGEFSRIPASMITLAAHTGLFTSELIKMAPPILAAAAAIGLYIKHEADIEKMNQELGKTEAILAGTGRAGLESKTALTSYVDELKRVGESEADAFKSINAIFSQGSLGGASANSLIKLLPDIARAMGQDMPAAAAKFAKALGDPLNGVQSLDKELNFLTLEEYKQIESMKQHKDAAGIQAIAIEALQRRFEGLRNEGMTPVQKAWLELKAAFTEKDSVEKQSTIMSNLAKNLSLAADAVKTIKEGWQRLVDLVDKHPWLVAAAGPGMALAAASGTLSTPAASAQEKLAADIQKYLNDIKTKEDKAAADKKQSDLEAQQRAKERYEIDKQLTAQQIDDTLKIEEIQNKAAKEYYNQQAEIFTIGKRQNDQIQAALDIQMLTQKKSAEQQKAGLDGITEVERKQHLDAMVQIQQEIDARKSKLTGDTGILDFKAAEDQRKADADMLKVEATEQAKSIDQLNEKIRKQKEHNDAIGKTKEQVVMLTLAEIDRGIAMLMYDRAMNEFNVTYVAQLDEQIAKMQELRGLVVKGAQLDGQQLAADQAIKAWKDAGAAISTSLSKAFGDVGKAIGGMFKIYADGMAKQMELDKQYAASADKQNKHTAEQQQQYQQDTAINSVRTYGDMADSAAGFFDKNSKGYEVLTTVSRVFHLAELAMEIAKMVPKAINAILTQGEGDPYTAFARMAAMAAIVAGLGVAVGGSGGGAPNLAAQRQAAQGTGTTLGDPTVASNSIGKAIEIIKNNSSGQLEYQSAMARSLASIDTAMAGLAAIVAKTVGLSPEQISGLNLGTHFDNALGGITHNINTFLLGPANSFLSRLSDRIVGFFLGSTRTSLNDSGLSIDAQTVAQARSNFQGSSYADITTTTSGIISGILGRNGSSTSRHSNPIDEATAHQFELIIGGIADSIAAAMSVLSGKSGTDLEKFNRSVADFIDSMNIPQLDISFKDLTGDALQQALEKAFSGMGDTMAQTVIEKFMPGVEKFQKVGEGLFQTLIRVASGVEEAGSLLERFHVKAIDFNQVINKTGDVATEIVRQSLIGQETISDKVLRHNADGTLDTSGETLTGVGKILQAFVGTAEDLANLYQKLLDIRVLMRATGMDAQALDQTMITAAGGIDKLTQGLQSYKQNFFTPGEQAVSDWSEIRKSFRDAGLEMPHTNAQFRAMVEGLDLNTEAGKREYGMLMSLAPAFSDATAALASLVQSLGDLKESAYQFIESIDQKISGAGGTANPAALALQHAQDIQASYGAITDPSQQVTAVGNYVSAIDTWYQQRSATINARIAQENADAQAAAAAENAARQAETTALQTQLQLAQQWTSVLANAKQMLDSMQLTNTNPLASSGQLSMATSKSADLFAQFQAASGQDKVDLANKLLPALQAELGLVQSNFQRPSDQYVAAYNRIIAMVSAVQGTAKTESDKAVGLQQELVDLQQQGNVTAATFSAQNDAEMIALNKEYVASLEWAKTNGAAAYQQQIDLTQQQIDAITGGIPLDQFMANTQVSMLNVLITIANNTNPAGATSAKPNPYGGPPTFTFNITAPPASGSSPSTSPLSTAHVVAAVKAAAPVIKRILATG